MDIIVALCLAPLLVISTAALAFLAAEYRFGFCSEHVRMTRLKQGTTMPGLTVLIAEQVVRLSRVVLPPVIGLWDRMQHRALSLMRWRVQNATAPAVQVSSVRPPLVISNSHGHLVQVDFTLTNTGNASNVSYWVEFPVDELHDRETTTRRLFTSERRTVAVPALAIQRVHNEFAFPSHSVPLATTANKASARALVSP